MRIWSWQHVSVIHCWGWPSLLLSSWSYVQFWRSPEPHMVLIVREGRKKEKLKGRLHGETWASYLSLWSADNQFWVSLWMIEKQYVRLYTRYKGVIEKATPGHTARLKWKKGFLAAGFPIFWRRWSDQTFSIINDITKTEKTFCCWFFLKTKYLSNILVKIVASRLWIRYKTWLLKKIQWCWPPAEDLF